MSWIMKELQALQGKQNTSPVHDTQPPAPEHTDPITPPVHQAKQPPRTTRYGIAICVLTAVTTLGITLLVFQAARPVRGGRDLRLAAATGPPAPEHAAPTEATVSATENTRDDSGESPETPNTTGPQTPALTDTEDVAEAVEVEPPEHPAGESVAPDLTAETTETPGPGPEQESVATEAETTAEAQTPAIADTAASPDETARPQPGPATDAAADTIPAPEVQVRVLTQEEDEANRAAIRDLKVLAVLAGDKGVGVYTSAGELRTGKQFGGMDIARVTNRYVIFECGNKRYKWMLPR